MKVKPLFFKPALAVSSLALLAAAPLHAAVDRWNHGSIRHADVGAVRREEGHREAPRRYDVEVDHRFGRDRAWHGPGWGGVGGFLGGLVAGAAIATLPEGYETMNIGGAPYYYYGGNYYQPGPNGGYVVVNPPSGAAVTGPPPDSIPVAVDGQTYYDSNGTFYVQQGANFVTVPAPLGVTVPELPAGATQVTMNGMVYYQYNGVYYQPVFQNGVTMYMTVAPQ